MRSSLCHLALAFILSSTQQRSEAQPNEWIVPDNHLLPRTDYGITTAIYNDTVYLLGGIAFPQQSIEFDPVSKTFKDNGAVALNTNISCDVSDSTSYTQIGHFLFWMQSGPMCIQCKFCACYGPDTSIKRYDLVTQDTITVVDMGIDVAMCLTSHRNMLFRIGGDDVTSSNIATVLVYDINGVYLGLVSGMFNTNGRYGVTSTGCVANSVDDALYSVRHYGIQRISTIDMLNQTWQMVGDENGIIPESESLIAPRCVSYKHTVWILGGNDANSVYMLDVTTDILAYIGKMADGYVGGYMGGYSLMTPLVLGDTLYLFGGRNGTVSVDTWQYLELLPADPTTAPTRNPTTTNPSSAPSLLPSVAPSRYPSVAPSHHPSVTPSRHPSIAPINALTDPPTNYTISIVFRGCEQENESHPCDINETTITNEIDAIIVAYIDYDTHILSTEIINNEMVIIVAIDMDQYNSLLRERMSDRIENELEDKYGDIDVIVKETNDKDETDEPDDTPPTKENQSWGFIVYLWVFVAAGTLVLVAVFCILNVRRKRVRVQFDQNMAEKELQDVKVVQNSIKILPVTLEGIEGEDVTDISQKITSEVPQFEFEVVGDDDTAGGINSTEDNKENKMREQGVALAVRTNQLKLEQDHGMILDTKK